MNTLQRARVLAEIAGRFPLLGAIAAEDLVETVRLELGHAETLDGFRPYGGHFSKAIPRSPILHVISGNTPHAALQSLTRGLLLGARNLVKLPSAGLPEAEEFLALLPPELRTMVDLRRELPAEWLRQASTWIVYGSDETVAHFRRQARAGVVFEAHPHRVSVDVVFDDPTFASVSAAAEDVSRFAQKGCLSPHDIFVAGDAKSYAARLATEMALYEARDPRGPVTTHEAAEIADIRANYRFRAASDPRVALWESEGSNAWTVIYEDDPWFASSCLNRVAFVKPLPTDLEAALGPALPWLGAVGVWPPTPEAAERILPLRPSRICAVGQMQNPAMSWHQEGRQTLAPLVSWVDFDPQFR